MPIIGVASVLSGAVAVTMPNAFTLIVLLGDAPSGSLTRWLVVLVEAAIVYMMFDERLRARGIKLAGVLAISYLVVLAPNFFAGVMGSNYNGRTDWEGIRFLLFQSAQTLVALTWFVSGGPRLRNRDRDRVAR